MDAHFVRIVSDDGTCYEPFLLRCLESTLVFDTIPASHHNCCIYWLSGLLDQHNCACSSVVSDIYQWYLWGYSLAFTPAVPPPSPGKSWYGGDSRGLALHDSLARLTGADGARIPELLYQFYEGMFASFT
jgi:hypothetical protein